jgi:hypothetical protein
LGLRAELAAQLAIEIVLATLGQPLDQFPTNLRSVTGCAKIGTVPKLFGRCLFCGRSLQRGLPVGRVNEAGRAERAPLDPRCDL